jgi:hypothetical protein
MLYLTTALGRDKVAFSGGERLTQSLGGETHVILSKKKSI